MRRSLVFLAVACVAIAQALDNRQNELKDAKTYSALEKKWFKCGLYNILKSGCCNGQLYVRKTHACCQKKVIMKHRCGGKRYDPCTHGCCRKGNSAVIYSRRFKKCCKGKIQWKIFTKYCSPFVIHG